MAHLRWTLAEGLHDAGPEELRAEARDLLGKASNMRARDEYAEHRRLVMKAKRLIADATRLERDDDA